MKRWLIILLGLTLALAACGGDAGGTTTTAASASTNGTSTTAATTTTDDGDESTTTSTTAATTTTTATTTTGATTTTTTAATTTTTAAVTTTTAAAGGSTVIIRAENFGFSPSTATIRVGDTVQWVLSEGSHTTTSGAAPTPDGLWNQVITADAAPVSFTFDQAGQFRFYCRFHPDMQGTVVVEP